MIGRLLPWTGSATGNDQGARSGSIEISAGPYARDEQYIGGLTIVDVADEERARYWAGRIAEACGWPQVARRLY